jgi:eukaryotic-like serine/threonine-protein kinase
VASDNSIAGYKLINLMMSGQTSQVWEVVEPGSYRHLAMKLLLPEHVKTQAHRNFLFHEAEVGLAIHHPNVIKILKLEKTKANPFILMEFFPGGNLKRRLMLKHDILREKTHSIIKQAATGLAAIHEKGWVHRDVKPDNILVNSAGEVRIIDFALAKRIKRSESWFPFFKKKSTASGTRSYMSPEQILNRSIDERADVYSFGATLYEVVTGKPPLRGANPNDLLAKHLKEMPVAPRIANPEVTDQMSDLIYRMLAKDKKDRPKDLHEFLAQFRGIRVFKTDKAETSPRE